MALPLGAGFCPANQKGRTSGDQEVTLRWVGRNHWAFYLFRVGDFEASTFDPKAGDFVTANTRRTAVHDRRRRDAKNLATTRRPDYDGHVEAVSSGDSFYEKSKNALRR